MRKLYVYVIINSRYQVFDLSGKLPFSIVFGPCRRMWWVTGSCEDFSADGEDRVPQYLFQTTIPPLVLEYDDIVGVQVGNGGKVSQNFIVQGLSSPVEERNPCFLR